MATSPAAVEFVDIAKSYRRARQEVAALRGVSLVVPAGQFLAIVGPSGSGKSTLLNLVSGLDQPDHGDILVDGTALSTMTDDRLTQMRRTRVGIVFQFFNLLPSITALENVALPLRATGMAHPEMLRRAHSVLDTVGLSHRADHLPLELAGGEMQRVAIARALVIEPKLILADEPTGNLDSLAGDDILQLLRRCNRDRHVTVMLVTHNAIAAAYSDRVVTLHDGRVIDDILNRPPKEPSRLRPVP
jgi:putative ABC transport system ATP-binding protein